MVTRKSNKSKNKIIIAAVILGVLVLAGVGFILIKNLMGNKFEIDSENKYIVETEEKWRNMTTNDDYDSIYYQIDLGNMTVSKKEEIFTQYSRIYEGLDGEVYVESNTEEKIIYVKDLNDELSKETKRVLDEALAEKDVNRDDGHDCGYYMFMTLSRYRDDQYHCFTVSTLNRKEAISQDVVNLETVDKIKDLLEKYDEL